VPVSASSSAGESEDTGGSVPQERVTSHKVSAEEWGRKGATLSDKTACSQYRLTQEEIYAAIDTGKLQYRPATMHGNLAVAAAAPPRGRGPGRGPQW
jgi:hypothetical protein